MPIFTQQEIDAYKAQPMKAPVKQSPRNSAAKTLIASLLPTIGGAAGAIAGTAVAPLAGTAIGGAGGSALGEALRQRLLGEDQDLKKIGIESAFGAVPGVFRFAKGAKTAATATKAATAVDDVARTARVADEGAESVGSIISKMKRTTPTGVEAPLKTSVRGKVDRTIDAELLKQLGTVTQPVARANKAPETVRALSKAGLVKPEDWERTAHAVTGSDGILNRAVLKATGDAKYVDLSALDDVLVKSLDDSGLTTNNRKALVALVKGQKTALGSDAEGLLSGPVEPSKVMEAMKRLEAQAREFLGKGETYHLPTSADKGRAKVLMAVRNEMEKQLYEGAGANQNLKNILTSEVRDELVNIHPGNAKWAKHVDDNIMTATDIASLRGAQKPFVRIARLIDNAADNAVTYGGRMTNGANTLKGEVFNKAFSSGRGAVARTAAKVRGSPAADTATKTPSLLGKFVKGSAAQVPARLVAAPFRTTPPEPEEAALPPIVDPNAGVSTPEEDAIDYDKAAREALSVGDYDAFNAIMKLADRADKKAAGGKPLSTAAAKDIANAQAGLDSVSVMMAEIAKDPSVVGKSSIPGAGLFGGLGDAALGTGSYEAAKGQVIDIIARMRTGATISDEEAKRFEGFIPQTFDSEELRAQKLQTLAQMFQTVADRQNTGATVAEVQ